MNSAYGHAHTNRPFINRHWKRGRAGVDFRGEIEELPAREREMVSIIEYSAEKKARNSYPHKIISPPMPSRCCQARMSRIGSLQADGDHKFYYKRCSHCGFTVREFVSATDVDRLPSAGVSDWDGTERWLDRIQREVQADIAA